MKRFMNELALAALGATLSHAAGAGTHFTTIYSTTGGYPNGVFLIRGTVYGTLATGTCGSVYELQPPAGGGTSWTVAPLYTFAGGGDACDPGVGLHGGAGGAVYGTAWGGTNDAGALYELQPPASPGGAWTESVVYSFTFTVPGFPTSGLVDGPEGSFYVFDSWDTLLQLLPPVVPALPWTAAQLWSPPGTLAPTGPIAGPDGSLYGAGQFGGQAGYGNVFQARPPASPGGSWAYQQLYSFGEHSTYRGPDNPNSMVLASGGTIYGTTYGTSLVSGIEGDGAVYELKPPASSGGEWSFTVLKNFGEQVHPIVPLVLQGGNLYGGIATPEGGAIFEIEPPSAPGEAWTTTYLREWTDGQVPSGNIAVDKDGTIFGTTGSIFSPPPYTGTIFMITAR
jgi:hypothetical protein